MVSLTQLKTILDNENKNGSLALNLANDTITAISYLADFLKTLPTKQLSFSGTTITLDTQRSTPTLTVVGNINEDWPIRGTGSSVHIGQVTLLFTEEKQVLAAQLSADGTLSVGSSPIEVTGTLDSTQQLTFTLKTSSANPISLKDIANFISDSQLAPYLSSLPSNVTIFENVLPTTLSISFGFGDTATTSCTFTSASNADWSVIDSIAALQKVSITLNAQFTHQKNGNLQATIDGTINATLSIQQQDFTVRLTLQKSSDWTMDVVAAKGQTLPNLSTLAELVGLQTNELDQLGISAPALSTVSIDFDIAKRQLKSIVIVGSITVEGITFDIHGSLPPLKFDGSLPSSKPINLRILLGKYFAGVDVDAFPAVDITQLNVQLDSGSYTLDAHIDCTGGKKMQVRGVTLGFETFDFKIVKNSSGVTGSLDASFKLANAKFAMDTTYTAGAWQFHGQTVGTNPLPIGNLMQSLATLFSIDSTFPAPLAGLTLDTIDIAFSTTGNFTCTCAAKFPIDGQDVAIVVAIVITKDAKGQYSKSFGGQITIGDTTNELQFDLHFSQKNTSTAFVATYSHAGTPQSISIHSLVADISTEVADYVPKGLTIDLKDVIFAFDKSSAGSTFLLGLDISANIPSLSNLPLVGKELPADQTITVNDLQLVVVSKEVKQQDVTNFNTLVPAEVTKLPETDLSKGFNLSASMDFGGSPQILAVPVVSSGTTSSPAPAASAATNAASNSAAGVTSADNAKWFALQKSFGPVYFKRVGVKYDSGIAWFLLDASLSVAILTLSLDGLAFGSSLSKFTPEFDLHGLGLDYTSGPIEIGGAFLRTQGTYEGKPYDEYDGAAVLKAEELTLSALGSYAVVNGATSLFIYAVLDYPLGGPSFFFITGLAAGFGYNRSLVMPDISQVAQFPLVSAAVKGDTPPKSTTDLANELQQLDKYVPPDIGEMFFAIGIKFTSFKIIDSFVLLAIAFGNELEIDVLGLSTMLQPPPVPDEPPVTPLAEVQMAVKISFVPAQGFLGVSAQLTSASYLISTACCLTGGFAFYVWFAGVHSGEFVQTLGGYHPSFHIPDYYPRVPRLGYNWQVDDTLSIKGGAYFALTTSMLMAGLQVQANWNSDNLQAWFDITIDFLIAWKPFHYDATAHAELGISYTFNLSGTQHLNFDVSADLHIWGPEFSGHAHIHLDIVSFDISFGASAAQAPTPISWDTFKKSFLPSDADMCNIAVISGLVGKQNQNNPNTNIPDLGVINPKEFVLTTNAAIPSSHASIHNDLSVSSLYSTQNGTLIPFSSPSGYLVQQSSSTQINIGSPVVGPMGDVSITSTHTILITRNGSDATADFAYTPILKNLPAALWGSSFSPDFNTETLVNNALTGFEIRPAVPTKPSETASIKRSNLQYEPGYVSSAYNWPQTTLKFQLDSPGQSSSRQTISTSIIDATATEARKRFCEALGLDVETIELNQDSANALADAFLVAPQVGTWQSA